MCILVIFMCWMNGGWETSEKLVWLICRTARLQKDSFGQSLAVPEECKTCQWFLACASNGCRRDRDVLPNRVIGQNIYCTAYKKFFSERFRQLAQSIECIQRMQYR